MLLLDVRQPEEIGIASLAGTIQKAEFENASRCTGVSCSGVSVFDLLAIPLMELADRVDELAPYRDRQTEVIVYCRIGERSRMAAEFLNELGFARVANLRGGIVAFANQVDSSLPIY